MAAHMQQLCGLQPASRFSSSRQGLSVSAPYLRILEKRLSCFTFSLTQEFTLDWRVLSFAAFDSETNVSDSPSRQYPRSSPHGHRE